MSAAHHPQPVAKGILAAKKGTSLLATAKLGTATSAQLAASDGVGQEEADAVAALLDFGAEAGEAAQEAALRGSQPEYLVKFAGRSHAHNEWVPESTLMQVRTPSSPRRNYASFFVDSNTSVQ